MHLIHTTHKTDPRTCHTGSISNEFFLLLGYAAVRVKVTSRKLRSRVSNISTLVTADPSYPGDPVRTNFVSVSLNWHLKHLLFYFWAGKFLLDKGTDQKIIVRLLWKLKVDHRAHRTPLLEPDEFNPHPHNLSFLLLSSHLHPSNLTQGVTILTCLYSFWSVTRILIKIKITLD
jgi:hypothetical protein